MNILIVKLSAVGDVIHTLPAAAALRRRYPGARIAWVVEEAASDLILGHPHLDEVIVSRRKRWISDLRSGRIGRAGRDIRAFLDQLRARRYDLVIDFHGLFKSAVIVLFSGGRRRLGYDSMQELSGLFYNEKIPEDMGRHAVDRYLDFTRYLGAETGAPEFVVPEEAENRARVKILLTEGGIGAGDPFVAVSPQALWETKLWENDRFARLCDRIVREMGVPVVLTGSEGGSVTAVQSLMTAPAVHLGGRTSLRDLACLYRQASLLITTDSGPMHLAAAVNTPVVALFGPTDPARTGPYGKGHVVIRRGLACSPCLLKACGTRQCMRDITEQEVFAAVREKFRDRTGCRGVEP